MLHYVSAYFFMVSVVSVMFLHSSSFCLLLGMGKRNTNGSCVFFIIERNAKKFADPNLAGHHNCLLIRLKFRQVLSRHLPSIQDVTYNFQKFFHIAIRALSIEGLEPSYGFNTQIFS